MRLSLQHKILLLVAGTTLLLGAVLLAALSVIWHQQSAEAIRRDDHAAGELLSVLLRDKTEELRDQVELIAEQPTGIQAIITTNNQTTFEKSAEDYQDLLDVDTVIITNRNATTTGVSGFGGFDKNQRFLKPIINAALEGSAWDGVVGDQSQLLLCVCVPVTIHGSVKGAFCTCRSVDSGLAADFHDSLGSDVAFVYDGYVIGASLPLPPRIPTPHDASQVVTLEGNRYIALSGPVPGAADTSKMSFVTLRPYDQAMALYYRSRLTFVSVVVATLLIALSAGIILARNLTRPLGGIMQAAHTLRAGKWPEQFDIRRTDEIGLLQSTFNEMSAAMQTAQERLFSLLRIDPLTELENHRSFQERLAQEGRRCAQSGEPISVVLLDIDHFHEFNQRCGHAGGDEALIVIAGILRERLPEFGTGARYGGNEFAALLPRHDLAQAAAVGERLRASVEAALAETDGLTVSVGCAELGAHANEVEGVLLAAELARARAKQLGRNQVCRFDSVPGAEESSNPFQLHQYLKDESLATIQALAAAVDAKDAYTRGHSQNVAGYASELAKRIGLPQAEITLIHTAGTLHDVGKIGVPDAILKKPERLEDNERKIMETHPALGEVIVRKVPTLASILPAVRHHHERWDGLGYPDRLQGEEIPMMARLLALADTYDAMTSDRPYRKGLSHETALAEIARQSGTQFDPALAEQFVALMTECMPERTAA